MLCGLHYPRDSFSVSSGPSTPPLPSTSHSARLLEINVWKLASVVLWQRAQTQLFSDLWIANLTAPLFLSVMLNWQQKAPCLNLTAVDFWISLKIKVSLSSLSMWTCVQTLISLWKLLLCCHILCTVRVCATYQCHSVNLKWRVFLRGSFTHKCRNYS